MEYTSSVVQDCLSECVIVSNWFAKVQEEPGFEETIIEEQASYKYCRLTTHSTCAIGIGQKASYKKQLEL